MARKREIVVTDLTRFSNPDILCSAGIEPTTGRCVRPQPYLRTRRCRELDVRPSTRLRGDFKPERDRHGPHQEDCRYRTLTVAGRVSWEDFRRILLATVFPSAEAGFECEFAPGQRHVPIGAATRRSLITIQVVPQDVSIVQDRFRPGKVKLHFVDGAGRRFEYVSITDLGFHDFARAHHSRRELHELERWVRSQREVLLRLGLSQPFRADDQRHGYWLQANGVYTFPEEHPSLRHTP